MELKKAVPREEPRFNSGGGGGGQVSSPQQTKKVFLGGLPPELSEDELSQAMGVYGVVNSVSIITEKETNKPRGFGFAVFKDFESAESVYKKKYIKIRVSMLPHSPLIHLHN